MRVSSSENGGGGQGVAWEERGGGRPKIIQLHSVISSTLFGAPSINTISQISEIQQHDILLPKASAAIIWAADGTPRY